MRVGPWRDRASRAVREGEKSGGGRNGGEARGSVYAGRAYRSRGYAYTLSISSGTRDAALPAGVQESRGHRFRRGGVNLTGAGRSVSGTVMWNLGRACTMELGQRGTAAGVSMRRLGLSSVLCLHQRSVSPASLSKSECPTRLAREYCGGRRRYTENRRMWVTRRERTIRLNWMSRWRDQDACPLSTRNWGSSNGEWAHTSLLETRPHSTRRV
jgi:hypothetical protein